MQDLHADASALGVHRTGDEPMLGDTGFIDQHRRTRQGSPLLVRRNPARHDQPDTAPRTGSIERRHPLKTVGRLFEAGVHGTHEDTIRQRTNAEIQRSQ